ncbi:MAG: DUF4169 family protein [Bradyrhizobium sp.]|nr:MAG: DUF4169 family protein [Bradyrhizobium sp.]
MAEIVNLRRARKRRVREREEASAAANRLAHGISKTARRDAEAERERAERSIEGHRREQDPSDA